MIEGQDIVITALWPQDPSQMPELEWMTLPEALGVDAKELHVFRTSIRVTVATKQRIMPQSGKAINIQ